MIRSRILRCLGPVLLLAGCATKEARPVGNGAEAEPAKWDCRGLGRAPESQLAAHARLRRKAGLTVPTSPERVLLYFGGGHHTRFEVSVAAARDPSGAWILTSVSEETSDILTPGRTAAPTPTTDVQSGRLEGEQARRLDAIVSSARLYKEPKYCERTRIGVGAIGLTLEVATPKRSRISEALAYPPGLSGELVEQLIDFAERAPKTRVLGGAPNPVQDAAAGSAATESVLPQ